MCKNLHWKFWKSKVHWREKHKKLIYVWTWMSLACIANCIPRWSTWWSQSSVQLCADFGSNPLHIARGALLGNSKLEVMPLWQVLETFSSLRFRDFLSQSFAVPIYQVCYPCRRVSAGQPAILRWEHSWKAKLLMYFCPCMSQLSLLNMEICWWTIPHRVPYYF